MMPTACIKQSKENGNVSALKIAKQVIEEQGVSGLYRGSSAVAMRQATNWCSRQGITEFVRARVPVEGAMGEIMSGCIGGALSSWNTPLEVARIEAQSKLGAGEKMQGKSLVATIQEIVDKRGFCALYVGLIPRACQACYQTLFLVTVPRLMK